MKERRCSVEKSGEAGVIDSQGTGTGDIHQLDMYVVVDWAGRATEPGRLV